MHPREPSRLSLAQLPTPVVELKRIANQLGIERLLMKRDDLTGLETSGNKIRKLEYVLADALAQGADTVITHGGYQSNHCRATAAAGAALGLRVLLLLRSPENPALDGNLFLDHLFGAQVTLHSPEEMKARLKELIEQAMDAERRAGRKPYFFPVGASIPLGCWGYIRCAAELAEQIGRETRADIFVAVGSSGTYAGLMLGKALLGLDNFRMIGVPVCDSVEFFQRDVRSLVDETIETYGLKLNEPQTPIELIDGFIGEGYAVPYPEALRTLRQVATSQGILLDPTYTSKAMTGCLATIRAGGIRQGAVPVFIHTGGVFGLMARRDLFDDSFSRGL